MKSLFLLTVLAVPMLLTGCVEHEVVVHRGPNYHPYHPYRREVVVAEPAPVGVVYYTDHRGRYYWRHHRRVYVRVY